MLDDIPRRPIGEGHRSKHPVVSFFQVLRERFKDRLHHHQSQLQQDPKNDDEGDDGILNITFSSIDDVIEFYKSEEDDDDDSECDSEWEDVLCLGKIPGQEDCYEHADDDDAIVSSWIDNYHYLLVEQEQRKRKKVRFEVSETIDCFENSPSSNVVIVVDDADADDDCSLSSSCCSSSTESTWHSLDTTEEQEFEEFANTWRDNRRKIKGKNNTYKKSLLGRLLWEILLIDPLDDEDFEVDDEDGTDYSEPAPDPRKSKPEIESKLEIVPTTNCGTDCGRFPSDLLFSIETTQ
jgi:hypothetical protein